MTASQEKKRGGVTPNYASEDLKEVDKKVKSMMELSAKFISNGKKKPGFAKCAEKKGKERRSEITLK